MFKSLQGHRRLSCFWELKEVIRFTKGCHTSGALPQERPAEDVGLHNSFPSWGMVAVEPLCFEAGAPWASSTIWWLKGELSAPAVQPPCRRLVVSGGVGRDEYRLEVP